MSETVEEIPVLLVTGTSVYMGEGSVLILFRSYFKKLDMFLKSLVNLKKKINTKLALRTSFLK